MRAVFSLRCWRESLRVYVNQMLGENGGLIWRGWPESIGLRTTQSKTSSFLLQQKLFNFGPPSPYWCHDKQKQLQPTWFRDWEPENGFCHQLRSTALGRPFVICLPLIPVDGWRWYMFIWFVVPQTTSECRQCERLQQKDAEEFLRELEGTLEKINSAPCPPEDSSWSLLTFDLRSLWSWLTPLSPPLSHTFTFGL